MDATLHPGAGPAAPRAMAPPGPVHPEVAELAFLLGTWSGEGEGEWPGSQPFRFGERLAFEHVGDAFLLYEQRSWSLEDGAPIHLERGFLRPDGSGGIELVLAHPIGIAEVAAGTVRDRIVELASTSVGLTGTASHVTKLRRRIEVRGEELVYELWMAMDDVPMTSHVRSRLRREP